MDAAAELGPAAFRRVMGRFATGVTVVAVEVAEGVHGMTANAVTSVSLQPPLVLVCVDRRARMHRYLAVERPFSINILRQEQEPLSRYFSGTWPHPTPPEFRFQRWEHGPLLVGALAAVGCRMHRLVRAGDHTVVLGQVTALHEGEAGQPLVFFGGRYRRLMEVEAYAGAPADAWTHESVRIHYDEP